MSDLLCGADVTFRLIELHAFGPFEQSLSGQALAAGLYNPDTGGGWLRFLNLSDEVARSHF